MQSPPEEFPPARSRPAGPPAAPSEAIARWNTLEEAFSAGHYSGDARRLVTLAPDARQAGAGVFVIPGTRLPHVVVTAVHGTNHQRGTQVKWADRGTGSLAVLLAEMTGCTTLVVTTPCGDANHDFTHPAKTALLNLPGAAALVDLHGSAHLPDSPDIEIGTAAGHVPAGIMDHLTGDTGLRVVVDTARRARDPRRITMLAQTHGIRALQLEIDARLRPPAGDATGRQRLLDTLAAAITAADPSSTRGPRQRNHTRHSRPPHLPA